MEILKNNNPNNEHFVYNLTKKVTDTLKPIKGNIPNYWVPDHLCEKCYGCDDEFGPKLKIHHCRQCGNGFCSRCSNYKRKVNSRGLIGKTTSLF